MNLDELERLERKATESKATTGEFFLIPRDEIEFIAALRNSARELIADARRYRWLRDKAWSVGHSAPAVCMVDESGRPFLDMDNFAADPIMEGRELDLNIDAALAQEQK